jgi:citrate lyase subunit beta / citryl-CoA lyase
MTGVVRPRRSVLYVPGSNARALEKARGLRADVFIFDLEDAVAPGAKENARATVAASVAAAGGYGGREMLLRVNALGTEWAEGDLAAAAGMAIDGVLLPKVESVATIRQAEAVLAANGARDDLSIWCMMETPLGILRATEIAAASGRLGGLVMGTSDLAKDLNARQTADRSPMFVSLGICLLAARAYGLPILDGVHVDLSDEAGFRAACRQGAELGFDGKTLIHPKTIAAANEIFGPSPADVEWSRRVVAAHREGLAKGLGVVVLDGKLIEQLHVDGANRILDLVKAIAGLSSPAG